MAAGHVSENALLSQKLFSTVADNTVRPRFTDFIPVFVYQVCVPNHRSFQDIASIVAISDTYATTEPFIPGKCDIRIQKIGNHYRAFK